MYVHVYHPFFSGELDIFMKGRKEESVWNIFSKEHQRKKRFIDAKSPSHTKTGDSQLKRRRKMKISFSFVFSLVCTVPKRIERESEREREKVK